VRALSLLILLLAAACDASRSQEASEPLVTSSGPGVVELRLARFGKTADCPHCILMEMTENQERVAYFVDAEPNCLVTRGGVYRLGADRAQGELYLALNQTGRKQVRSCRALVSKADVVGQFLVVHDAKRVGWAHLFFEPDDTLALELGDALDSVADVMNPERPDMSVAERIDRLQPSRSQSQEARRLTSH
jgi:hypothetical protein